MLTSSHVLSYAIWLPIAVGVFLLVAGRDRPGFTRWVALLGSLAGLLVTLPLMSGFDGGSAAMQFTEKALWIQRLNAAVRPFGMTYSRFIDGLSKSGITVDRKVLSDLAINEPVAFQAIAEKAKAALAA